MDLVGIVENRSPVIDDPVQASLPPLYPLEIHSGMIVGRRRRPPEPQGEPLGSSNVRAALEELLLPAISRPPCLVAFSGGRDSSVLLAVSVDLARRHQLNDPIPVTLRYEEHPRTWENEWQERMVRHLGLADWQILQVKSEVDALGPIAREALLRHGLFWPGNAQAMLLLLQAAGPGSLITGNGGDEAFLYMVGTAAKRASTVQIIRMNPLRKLLVYLPLQLLPRRARMRVLTRRAVRLPWLRPEALRELRRRYFLNAMETTGDVGRNFKKLSESRYFELARSAFAAFARDTQTLLCEPFFDSRFHHVAVESMPPGGYPSRNAALAALFGDLLPADVVSRRTKAVFTEVFWGPDSRGFAERWDGSGLDHGLIDPDELRREWSKPRPDLRSITPLQAAWLASRPALS